MHFGMEKIFRYALLLISGCFTIQTIGQDTLNIEVTGHITSMSVDAKGNFFVADDNFSLYKFNSKGQLITNVNIKTYGDIASIDCSNPFELYVYHQDQNIIVFYDNMLNIRGELRLNDLFYNVSCVSRSFDNHIWLVDLTEYKMLKINKKGDVLIETPYLNNILNSDVHPIKIWEFNNRVHVVDSVKGIYEFDLMGTYSTTYHFPKIDQATPFTQGFYLSSNHQLIGYRALTREPFEISSDPYFSKGLVLSSGKLFSYYKNKIISYRAR